MRKAPKVISKHDYDLMCICKDNNTREEIADAIDELYRCNKTRNYLYMCQRLMPTFIALASQQRLEAFLYDDLIKMFSDNMFWQGDDTISVEKLFDKLCVAICLIKVREQDEKGDYYELFLIDDGL